MLFVMIVFIATVLGIVVTSAWFWRWTRKAQRATTGVGARARRSVVARVLAVRTARRVRIARAEGRSVVTSVRGRDPAVVSYDGVVRGRRYDYRDPRRLRQDVLAGRVHHLATRCCGRPPKVGDSIRP
jgi:hypothetical protein